MMLLCVNMLIDVPSAPNHCSINPQVAVHHRPEGAIAISNSKLLMVTASADGHVATHTQSLNTIGSTAGDCRGGANAEAPPPASHDVSVGGAVAVAFDKEARCVCVCGSSEQKRGCGEQGAEAVWSGFEELSP